METTFSFVIHFLLVVVARNSVAGHKYQQDQELAGFACSAASLDFGFAVSSMACSAQCSKTVTCRGFFSSKTDGTCLGTPDIITSSASCSSKPGTVYFKSNDLATTTSSTTTTTLPPGQFGDTCSTDTDCSRTFSMCLQGSCSCQAGYRHETASGSCIANCSTYGSTYIIYQNMELNVDYTPYTATVAECQSMCTASITCRGFSACCGTYCRLKDLTPLTNPTQFFSFTGINYYSRNCV